MCPHLVAAKQSAWRGAFVSSATSPNTSPAPSCFTARFWPCEYRGGRETGYAQRRGRAEHAEHAEQGWDAVQYVASSPWQQARVPARLPHPPQTS